MSKPRRHLFQSTFSRIFIGIVLTSTFALTIAEILSYTQLKNSFDRFASRQIIVLQQIGREFFVKEDITMPADYQNFVAEYKEEINRQVLFSFGAGLFLSLIAGALISRQITRPIAALKDIITRVTKERYSLRAPESGSLEIRELTTAFNHLIEELEQQENLRQELLADMSHELKTPITKIRGQIEGIIDGIYQPESDTFKKVLVNIKQLEYLIQALYEVNQLSPQDIRLKLEKVKVKPLVEAAVSGLIKSGLNFNIDIDPKLTVIADRFRLRQIIDNLINNAFKYTQTGTITIKANHDVLVVKDTGIGIDTEHLSHIFERLYRVEKSRSKETGGLGLGLYIVKKLVSLHGWNIEASSQKNHGTTFTIVWRR
jgi:two-component system, OmpR family, sensor histidine kinase BaeS